MKKSISLNKTFCIAMSEQNTIICCFPFLLSISEIPFIGLDEISKLHNKTKSLVFFSYLSSRLLNDIYANIHIKNIDFFFTNNYYLNLFF